MLQRIKFYPKVVRVTKDYKILKTKEYGMTQCYWTGWNQQISRGKSFVDVDSKEA